MTKTAPEMDAATANARLIERRKTVKISIEPTEKRGKQGTTDGPIDPIGIADRFIQLGKEAAVFAAKVAGQLAGVKDQICKVHGCVTKPDLRRSVVASRQAGEFTAVFEPCRQCFQITGGPDAWKLKAGISMEFVGATLENWIPRDAEEADHLRKVHEFRKQRSGFLVMIGKRGTGKTHLGCALINHWHCGLILSQADLLNRLRKTYGDSKSEDIIERCQKAALLVVDEMGLSVGGKDELPMMHEILSHRHTNFKPTVLIGNITPGELHTVIGERMMDRLQMSLSHQLIFTGKSIRKSLASGYGKSVSGGR